MPTKVDIVPFSEAANRMMGGGRYIADYFDPFLSSLHTPELHRKYGPVVRISPDEVSIVTPDLVKTAYSHNKGTVNVPCFIIKK